MLYNKIILQHDVRDCGAACLAMVSAFYGKKLSLPSCRELTKTDRTGCSIYGIIDGAEQIGITAQALQGTPIELLDGIRNHEFAFPIVAHIVNENAMLHFVVLFGYKNGEFLVGDPAKGKRRISFEDFSVQWSGYIITFTPSSIFERGNDTKGSLRKFSILLHGQYKKLISIFIASLLVSAIGISGAFVFELVIDNFSEANSTYEEIEEDHNHESDGDESRVLEFLEKISESTTITRFNLVFAIIVLLYLLQAAIQYTRGYLIVLVAKKIDIRLTLSYYNHIVGLPVSSVSVRQTGEYLSRFSDADAVRDAISSATVTLILDFLMVLACGFILYIESSRLFFVSLIIVILYAIIVILYKTPIERANRTAMEKNAILQSFFKEGVDGIETIKSSGAESEIQKKTTNTFNSFINAVFRLNLMSISQETLADTVQLVGILIVLWIGFSMVRQGQITTGSLITFYALLSYFISPIKNLIELQPTIQKAFVAADRLNDILDLNKEDLGDTRCNMESISQIEISHLDFRYGNHDLVLRDISLEIHQGDKIAIVGESGCGKTTLAKLLLRFYEPESGAILLNGRDIRTFDLSAVRKNIAYVDQNTFLFSDTIESNLKLGNQEATENDIVEACKLSHADDFISSLPLGYKTPLDENGMNLSGGQRQRIAIARALLKSPQLLILDEATSNLDTVTESGIRDTIFGFSKELTCIIIAHRLTTIKNCDKIFVMEAGKIVEAGTFEELISANGKFTQFWKNQ